MTVDEILGVKLKKNYKQMKTAIRLIIMAIIIGNKIKRDAHPNKLLGTIIFNQGFLFSYLCETKLIGNVPVL